MRCKDMMDYVWTWASAVLDVLDVLVSSIIANSADFGLDLDIGHLQSKMPD